MKTSAVIRYSAFILSLTLFLSGALLLSFPAPAGAVPPSVTADAAVLMDTRTGRIFYDKNGLQRREPASLTKIMTAIIALEYGRLNDVVTVSRNAAAVGTGSVLDLRAGEKITLENLLKAALIMSANDSTVAIAEHVAGSEEDFIRMMNAKALVLGALHTRFANTNGYHDPQHYSCARDLAVITRYALQNPLFNRMVRTRETTVSFCDSNRKETIFNTNRLLREGSYPGIDGVKTGSTPRAGNCLIASATRGDRRFIAVVLHSANRYRDAVTLLEYGFNEVARVTLAAGGEEVARLPVASGLAGTVPVVVAAPVEVDLARDQLSRVQREVKMVPSLTAPVRAGQRVGEVVFRLKDEELARSTLVTARDVPKKGLFARWRKS
ncbi:D-alanyl-D-alanine carboxypeptidase (penicillin-binding protein 5/6) [Desulfofundulus luciae]|uniref:serine-type D-Ala-D-Ala carboxypeptidase n=1 Tax=Desulfofundulus luciae TaxID=74702 RepID=A0ABU0AZZ8_9FIRM|nr:D-alanyl-D-alanine carboxypeptidase family protein [Desulfofundulus luciae]MDQ0286034.1 D-alanyl-D-alanine carboxypeptidase (penicillin-binding protein 5/6) [Desulfofundulus luciae]